jgi:hypothetical protein
MRVRIRSDLSETAKAGLLVTGKASIQIKLWKWSMDLLHTSSHLHHHFNII